MLKPRFAEGTTKMMRKTKRSALPKDEILKRRLKELELLTKSSHALNATLDLDQLIGRILRIVIQALSVETASVLFPDPENEHLVFEMAHGKRGKEILGIKIPVGEGVAGWVAKHGKPLVINDLKKDRRHSIKLEKHFGLKTRSIMSIPLKRRNKLIGVIEAVNRPKKDPFTKDDLKIFLALGDHIATAIDNAKLYHEAERSRLENSLLYKISLALGKAISLDDVLDQILTSLRKLIDYDAAAIFVLDSKSKELVSHLQTGYRPGREDRIRLKLDEGIVGWAARNKRGAIVPDTAVDDRYISARRRTRSEIVAPMMSRGAVIGLFNLESNTRNAYTEDDLRLLDSFAAKAGASMERARLYEEERVKQGIERELKVARTVQEFFTPLGSQRMGKYTLAGRNYPSLELSGDYLDFFPLRKPYVAFAIADVAGKGVPASIIMAGFRATLHTVAPVYTSAGEIATRANQILRETVRPHDFVAAFIGVLNYETGEVTYHNAGHDPPILMRPNGHHTLLSVGGSVLGVFDSNDLQEGRFSIGDNLFFGYTDGAIDAVDAKDTAFGRRRLIDYIRQHRNASPSRICTGLRKRLREFTGDLPLVDDLTFLAIKKSS